jgi:hypothetical protein
MQDKTIGLVQGNELPVKGKSIFGKMMYQQFALYYRFCLKSSHITEWLTSGRGGRAFTKIVYQKLIWPSHVPEDVYALLWCKQRKIATTVAPSAICVYKDVENFQDFKNASNKVNLGRKTLYAYFPKFLVDNVYKRTFAFNLQCGFSFFFSNPFYFFLYFLAKIMYQKPYKASFDFLPAGKTTKQL